MECGLVRRQSPAVTLLVLKILLLLLLLLLLLFIFNMILQYFCGFLFLQTSSMIQSFHQLKDFIAS